ncbi:MAG: hypothetical protein ICV83_27845 [Cytophagales bacterium]|nr:hypothetical protein [Cytophagales bacterium]
MVRLQLADTCVKTRHCVRRSKALIEDARRDNGALRTQIDQTRAILAESRRRLAELDHAF